MRVFIYFVLLYQITSLQGNVFNRDFSLESKLEELEYDLEVIDYDDKDYTLAADEIEMNIEKIEEDLLSNEFGISTKKGQQKLSCGKQIEFCGQEMIQIINSYFSSYITKFHEPDWTWYCTFCNTMASLNQKPLEASLL